MPIHRFFLSDFVSIQRNSFLQFLEKGLIEEFSKLRTNGPLTNPSKTLEVFFYPEYYQLTQPKYSLKEAILKGKSYSSRLYIPVQLTDKNNRRIQFKWVYLADIPIMTKRGHFIINGAARVIVNQIIRSPGIYYQTKIYENYITQWDEKPVSIYERHYADLICQRGTWLRLEIDKKKKIWAQTKKGPKIPILWFLLAMGLTEKMILKSVIDPERLYFNMLEDPSPSLSGGQKITRLSTGKTKVKKQQPFPFLETPPEAWENIYRLFTQKKAKAKTINSNKKNQSQKKINEKAGHANLGRQLMFNKFMNPRTYDLSVYGRLNFNKKLNLEISPYQTTLTPQDILAATNHLIKVEYGLKKVDDIDHLKNRRVRTSGELIQIQFAIGLVRLEKLIRQKMQKIVSPPATRVYHSQNSKEQSWPTKKSLSTTALTKKPNKYKSKNGPFSKKQYFRTRADKNEQQFGIQMLMNTKSINSVLREFFGTSPLSQFMDQINPLAELTHKRRLSSMGPGGVTRDSATLDIRGIHPSHYGRICPVETPEGKNTGLVNSLTTYARVNEQGFIETPFYRVFKGQVQNKLGIFYFSAEHEGKIRLGAADLFASDLGFLSTSKIPVRIEEEFTKISRDLVEYVGVSPTQMVSIATSLIPFLEHDDANRALMGSNMQRQAVPLLKPERPIVGTGLEARAVSDSGHALQAAKSGLVTYVSAEKIIIYTDGSF